MASGHAAAAALQQSVQGFVVCLEGAGQPALHPEPVVVGLLRITTIFVPS